MNKVVLLAGDGIGPEIMTPAAEVLREVVDDLEFEEHLFGGASVDEYGVPLTDETLDACREAGAVLLGAVGGPKWDNPSAQSPRPEQGLLTLRKELNLYANLRPIRPFSALQDSSPLKPERIEGVDLLIVRELTGGIYFGEHSRSADGKSAKDVCEYSAEEIKRIAQVAFKAARHKVTSVDKANVLETSRLWREVVTETSQDYEIELEHQLVDNAAMQLVSNPSQYDVLLTENMFGDVLSDGASTITGSIGVLPSASVGKPGKPGVFEPIHGSAPDIAGMGAANPMGMCLSAAMMLRHGFSKEEEAFAIEDAVEQILNDGVRTQDLGGNATTQEVTEALLNKLG
jgi:3-isopropylmalate dehydrogenase